MIFLDGVIALTPYEQIDKFEIGLEMGLFSLDELRKFLLQHLRGVNVPYMYTDIFLSLDKGQDEVINTIFYNLQGNYTSDRSTASPIRSALIGAIRSKWDLGQIDTAQCVEYLQKLNDYFESDWNCLSIGEYYNLNRSGYCSDREFAGMLGKILLQGTV